MKIRNGFVSNSSSTSYIVYGWVIPKQKMEDICIENGFTEETSGKPPTSVVRGWTEVISKRFVNEIG